MDTTEQRDTPPMNMNENGNTGMRGLKEFVSIRVHSWLISIL